MTTFPPQGPTGLTSVIPSYLYQEYSDDDDLQNFVAAYNELAQNVLDTLNDLNLPIYTQSKIAGALLDWVAVGLYGMARPPLSSQRRNTLGPLNTSVLNGVFFNELKFLTQADVVATTDDFFKRILTWHLYKGDGKTFDVRWLKRRIMRFLTGDNGTSPSISQTYQVSVTFGTANNVSITLLTGLRSLSAGAFFNMNALNSTPFNKTSTSYQAYAPLENAEIFQDAVQTGALELPFQYSYTVRIGAVGSRAKPPIKVLVNPAYIKRYVTSGAIYNTFTFNKMAFDRLNTSNLPYYIVPTTGAIGGIGIGIGGIGVP